MVREQPAIANRHWDFISYALLFGFTVLAVATFQDYGNGFDAHVQDIYGKDILSWYRTGGENQAALNFRDLYYYGGFFDALAALIVEYSPFPHWATRHLMESVFGLVGLLGTWRLARYVAGPRCGVLAVILLGLMPSYYGMMFINPKDIPFAAAAIWSTYYITRITDALPRPPLRLIVSLGISIGIALGVRIAGVLLLAYLLMVLTAEIASRGAIAGWHPRLLFREAALSGARVALPVLIVAWVVMLPFWPWAAVSPIFHPLQALIHFSKLSNGVDTLYFGHHTSAIYHPASYLPVYLLIKLPDIVVALLAIGLGMGASILWRTRGRAVPIRLLPVFLAAIFPVTYTVATGAELYDAERHFLFVLPPLAVLSSMVADRIFTFASRNRVTVALCAVVTLVGTAHQVQAAIDLHPYEYAFFNDLVGGVQGAQGMFDTEYWGTSLVEATTNLRQYIHMHGVDKRRPWRVAICGEAIQMGDGPNPELIPVSDWKQADFFIASTRGGCDSWMEGRTIYTVEREGVPFAVVKDLRNVKQASGGGNTNRN